MREARRQRLDGPAASGLEQARKDAVGNAGQTGDNHRSADAAGKEHMLEIAFVTRPQMIVGNAENSGHTASKSVR